jgi:UDP-glucose 4-epimerase
MFSVVIGGAGFIGSHRGDALVAQGDRVLVIDSLISGNMENLTGYAEKDVKLIRADILADGWQKSLEGADRVYHLAADPDVRQSSITPDSQIRNNIIATQRVLEAMRHAGVRQIVFTSTSTVYGEASVIPTPEYYTPMEPVSIYGASKLACEALISAYCHSFRMQAWVYRFANIIGERSGHGVLYDFIAKLKQDPHTLEILGDGRQSKSYLEVKECVKAMLFAAGHSEGRYNVFNIGSEDWVDVKTIADTVTEEMGLPDVRYRFTGGERGWVGDVPKMQLSVEKLKSLGWTPGIGSHESIRVAVRSMLG